MVNRLRPVLVALLVCAIPIGAAAARLRLPADAPIPIVNPVKQKQAAKVARKGAAAARQAARWARRAGVAIDRQADKARRTEAHRATAAPRQAQPVPVPTPRPVLADPRKPETPHVQEARGSKADDKQASTAPLVSKATPVPMPADEVACRARLKAANVSFKEHEPLSDPLGCSSPYPISLDDLGLDIALEPAAVLNCHMAEAAVTYTRDVIAPLAAAEFETRLKGIRQASAYVCRPRNGTTKLSEHAFGNALDIAAFILEDGAEIPVEATRERERSEFLSRVRSKACGPFKTVLGPGSDADHATHFHLDLAQRRRGGTFCQ